MKTKHLFSWDARYGRNGTLCIGRGNCMKCLQIKDDVFTIDNSDDEYEPLTICRDCLNKLADNQE